MKHALPVTLTLLILFIVSHLLGLAIISKYVDAEKSAETGELSWKQLPSIGSMPMERPDLAPTQSIVYIVSAIIIGTLLILLIIRLNTVLLWKLWFFLAVTVCLHIALSAFIAPLYSIIISVAAAGFKTFRPTLIIHNLTELFLYGGLAAIFVPILSVKTAFILLILLSFYDAYAVWKSKHMITMAKFQTKSGIFAGLLLPSKGIPMPAKKSGKNVKVVMKPVKTAVLGGGDIGFPLLLSGTVLAHHTLTAALLVSAGASASLLCLLLLSQKNKFYPAIPFLTAGCALGYFVAYLLSIHFTVL